MPISGVGQSVIQSYSYSSGQKKNLVALRYYGRTSGIPLLFTLGIRYVRLALPALRALPVPFVRTAYVVCTRSCPADKERGTVLTNSVLANLGRNIEKIPKVKYCYDITMLSGTRRFTCAKIELTQEERANVRVSLFTVYHVQLVLL